MINKCINCGYFLNCKKASKEIENCEKFIKANRIINKRNKNRKVGEGNVTFTKEN